MSSDERWRSFKIVAPLTPNREEEIIGGLRNALDRGEPLEKAKQSFLNAGYKPEEVKSAVQKMPTTPQISNSVTAPAETKTPTPQPETKTTTQPLTTTIAPGQKKHLSKKFIIILVSIAALVLIGAALLGIYWDKLF